LVVDPESGGIEQQPAAKGGEQERRRQYQFLWPTKILKFVSNKLEAYRDKNKSAEYRRERREIWTARWLFLTVVFTFITAIIFYFQLGEMEKVYGPVKDSADAAKTSADALMAANGAQLWMDAIKITGIRTSPKKLTLNYTVRNFGNTPGWVHHKPVYVFFGTKLPDERTLNQTDTPDIMYVPSKHFTLGETVIERNITESLQAALLDPNPKIFMFVFGSIDYRDIFQNERRSGFAYQIKFGNGDASESTPIAGNEKYWDYQ
jgi:hypothetical protein